MILTLLDHSYLYLAQLPLDHCSHLDLDHHICFVNFLDLDHLLE
jgi:hypothetical protein